MPINLSWTAVSGATSYKIYRRSDTTTPTESDLLTTVTAPTVIYADSTGTTSHYYWIRAVNAYGGGGLTGPIHKLAVTTCLVSIDVADVLGVAQDDVILNITLSSDEGEVDNVVVSKTNQTEVESVDGVISVQLIPNILITPASTHYIFTFKDFRHITVRAIVPNAASANFKDLVRV